MPCRWAFAGALAIFFVSVAEAQQLISQAE